MTHGMFDLPPRPLRSVASTRFPSHTPAPILHTLQLHYPSRNAKLRSVLITPLRPHRSKHMLPAVRRGWKNMSDAPACGPTCLLLCACNLGGVSHGASKRRRRTRPSVYFTLRFHTQQPRSPAPTRAKVTGLRGI